MVAHEVIRNTREHVTSEAITRIAIDDVAPIVFMLLATTALPSGKLRQIEAERGVDHDIADHRRCT